MKQKWCN